MRIVAALALAATLTGCSFFSARGPDPRRAPDEVPRCNPGRGSVGLDGTMAVLFGLGALVAVAENEDDVAAGVGLVSLAYAGAAYYGARSAKRCRDALAEYEDQDEHEDEIEDELEDEHPAVAAPAPPAPAPAAARARTPARVPAPAAAAAAATDREPEPEPDPDAPWPDFWAEEAP